MNNPRPIVERRTSADIVFDHLYDEITSLRILPGAKMSEAEIAAQLGVSRQPVRDAFNRLGNIDLLLIRPQKATEVKRFSAAAITTARFVRTAIEIEVARFATQRWQDGMHARFDKNLEAQYRAVQDHDVDTFHKLDDDFHRQLCETAGAAFAFEQIMENKAQINRLCMLSMMSKDSLAVLVDDHRRIYQCLQGRDQEGIETAMRTHLSRLDETVHKVKTAHPDYFD